MARQAVAHAVLVIVGTVCRPALADYVVNRLHYVDPDTGAVAAYTQLNSFNRHGQAVGLASFDIEQTNVFSFVYDPTSGNFARFPQPQGFDGITTKAWGLSINDAGVITGNTLEPTGSRGLIFADGLFTFFSHPSWADTNGRSITNPTTGHPGGLIAGYLDDGLFDTPESSVGFLYDPVTGSFFTLDQTKSQVTLATDQNSSGQVVGSLFGDGVTQPLGQWAFVYNPAVRGDPMRGGRVDVFRLDGRQTRARAINEQGAMALVVFRPRNASDPAISTYVGSGTSFQMINVPTISGATCADGSTTTVVFPLHLSNAGQVSGFLTDSACRQGAFMATPAVLPTGTIDGAATFSASVSADAPLFISVPLATAYDYAVGHRDSRFATVRLPLGFGNNKYILVIGHRAFAVNAGQVFDFRAHGFRKGVRAFRVACIDPAAQLDPLNALAFPTELTFTEPGTFTGTQRALSSLTGRDHDPATQTECRELLLSLRHAGGPGDSDQDED